MRIIAGKHKARKLETLPGLSTRPMMDRMKESVFNIVGPFFEGGITLDLFGGSAALSLEAISRGCEMSYIVEMSKEAIKIINNNVNMLKENDNVKIYNMDYLQALKMFKKNNLVFDIIFLDPPYKLNVIDEIINYLLDNNMINKNGNIICQFLKNNYLPKATDNLELIKNYRYGNSEVAIYQLASNDEIK